MPTIELADKVKKLQEDVDAWTKRVMGPPPPMLVYSDWVVYFIDTIVLHAMKEPPVERFRGQKPNLTLFCSFRDDAGVRSAVDKILIGYPVTPSDFWIAVEFFRVHGMSRWSTVELDTPPTVENVDEKYVIPLQSIILAVFNDSKCIDSGTRVEEDVPT